MNTKRRSWKKRSEIYQLDPFARQNALRQTKTADRFAVAEKSLTQTKGNIEIFYNFCADSSFINSLH